MEPLCPKGLGFREYLGTLGLGNSNHSTGFGGSV